MCGRYDLNENGHQIEINFGIDLSALVVAVGEPAPYPAYNIAPTHKVLTIVSDGEHRQGQLMRWGLIPFFTKEINSKYTMINARAETVDTNKAYKEPFKYRRCLVPASGFFEWKKGPGKARQPLRITQESEEPFAFAGIWERWKPRDNPEADEILSCSIITTVPNSLIEPIHDRMPVILPPELYDDWMDPANQDIGELKEYLLPYDPSLMKAYPVSTAVNSVRNKGPEVIEAAEPLSGF